IDAKVPDPVEAVLRRRLRRLDDETRALLEAAAIALGANGDFDLIAHVAGLDAREAERLLRGAAQGGCLGQGVNGAIVFNQELLRRVVYDNISAPARAQMHGRAAEALEAAGL